MRSVGFAALLGLAACAEGNDLVLPTRVVWMDWPAEVAPGDPFRTRLVVGRPCASIRDFQPAPRADASAVTFTPYFVTDTQLVSCPAGEGIATDISVNVSLDTAGMAPGLLANLDRTYEMRGGTGVMSCPACALLNSLPWVTFGVVTVRPTLQSPSSLRNAAGVVLGQRDSAGCTRIRPSGLLNPAAAIVVENPADTTVQWYGFVRGYIYEPAAPVCGESPVFHLVSRTG
jgi:hypothetical protein